MNDKPKSLEEAFIDAYSKEHLLEGGSLWNSEHGQLFFTYLLNEIFEFENSNDSNEGRSDKAWNGLYLWCLDYIKVSDIIYSKNINTGKVSDINKNRSLTNGVLNEIFMRKMCEELDIGDKGSAVAAQIFQNPLYRNWLSFFISFFTCSAMLFTGSASFRVNAWNFYKRLLDNTKNKIVH